VSDQGEYMEKLKYLHIEIQQEPFVLVFVNTIKLN